MAVTISRHGMGFFLGLALHFCLMLNLTPARDLPVNCLVVISGRIYARAT
ncbi:hypothetical protein [Pseudomonas sp. R3-52-08]|nr:hypothetical protein [Pseudomonas sp. R3-52-08]